MIEAIFAIIFAICLILVLGEFGIVVLASLAFGFLFAVFVRTGQTRKDLKIIKEKLGIPDDENAVPKYAEVTEEADGEEAALNEPESEELRSINREIEQELEEYSEREGRTADGDREEPGKK